MKTVSVSKRGCGWPKEGGFYAIGGGKAMTCFALPVKLTPCDHCGQMPKFTRSPDRVTAQYLLGLFGSCQENIQPCHYCINEKATYWLSWIGSDYTADSFSREVHSQGLSRRLAPSFRNQIKPGDYFACVKNEEIITLIPVTSIRYYAKWNEKDDDEKIKKLEEEGIEVVRMDKVPTEGKQITI